MEGFLRIKLFPYEDYSLPRTCKYPGMMLEKSKIDRTFF
jgi:hypothetical protein